MNRREMFILSAAAALFAVPVVAQAEPLRLFHFEVGTRHFDVTDTKAFERDFDKMIEYRHTHGSSYNINHDRTYQLLALAKEKGIALQPIFQNIEPSDYFDDYRQVAFYVKTVNPSEQKLLNDLSANINAKADYTSAWFPYHFRR